MLSYLKLFSLLSLWSCGLSDFKSEALIFRTRFCGAARRTGQWDPRPLGHDPLLCIAFSKYRKQDIEKDEKKIQKERATYLMI